MSKELYTGELYWPTTLPEPNKYPPLASSRRVPVVIIGGGMSGSLCAYKFATGGMDTMLLERGEVAGGSTAANTGLLQFSNDMTLTEMSEHLGEHDAVAFYRACQEAVEQLEQVASKLGDTGFTRRSSLYYASKPSDAPTLRREYELLAQYGFNVEYLPSDLLAELFPFRKSGAMITHGDAEVNPFRFVHALADAASANGCAIHEHTDVVRHETTKSGWHRLTTDQGYTVEAEHVIYAIGYEPEELRGELIEANLNRTFALVTEPVPELALWHQRWLLWETARPYLYLRTTPDHRIIIGGLDERCPEPVHNEHLLQQHTKQLLQELCQLFPAIQADAAYAWSATFGESRDGLPFIGEDPKLPGVYYCLGYGGNGTVTVCLLRTCCTSSFKANGITR